MRKGFPVFVLLSTLVVPLVLINPPVRAASVSFDQISWGDGTGGFEDQYSQWGEASVSFSGADAASLAPLGSGYAGWVNIVTAVAGGSNNNWAVENMPVVFDKAGDLDGDLPFTYQFDLGQTDGSLVSGLSYSLTLSATPLTVEPSGSLTSGGVVGVTDLEGSTTNAGFEGDEAGSFAQDTIGAAVAGAVAGALIATNGRGTIQTSLTNIAVVAEQKNGCAPGAAARSIKYLQQMFPSSLNITQSAQQVYGTLTNLMQSDTGPTSRRGTAINNFISGKNLYFTTNNLSIAPTVVTTNFGQVVSALNSTGDVEIGVSWAGGGGHCIFVTGVTTLYTNGVPYRYIVNGLQDPKQGSGSISNQTTQYTFDTSGNLLDNGGGFLNSFRIETVTVPEPGTAELAGLGIGALALLQTMRRRRRT